MEITQTPLKRRAIIHGNAASQRETGVDYANTTEAIRIPGLRTLDEERVVL